MNGEEKEKGEWERMAGRMGGNRPRADSQYFGTKLIMINVMIMISRRRRGKSGEKMQ